MGTLCEERHFYVVGDVRVGYFPLCASEGTRCADVDVTGP